MVTQSMYDVGTITLSFVLQVLIGLIMLFFIRRYIDGTIDSVADIFGEVVQQPTMKSAMSIIGSKSADIRGRDAVVDKIAGDLLDGPKFAAIKIGASALGLNLDDYVEEHGALATIQGMQSVATMLGIDMSTLLSGQGTQGVSGGENPYI